MVDYAFRSLDSYLQAHSSDSLQTMKTNLPFSVALIRGSVDGCAELNEATLGQQIQEVLDSRAFDRDDATAVLGFLSLDESGQGAGAGTIHQSNTAESDAGLEGASNADSGSGPVSHVSGNSGEISDVTDESRNKEVPRRETMAVHPREEDFGIQDAEAILQADIHSVEQSNEPDAASADAFDDWEGVNDVQGGKKFHPRGPAVREDWRQYLVRESVAPLPLETSRPKEAAMVADSRTLSLEVSRGDADLARSNEANSDVQSLRGNQMEEDESERKPSAK